MANIRINGKDFDRGSRSAWLFVYGFFLLHMAMFGGAGFLLSYSLQEERLFGYFFSGFAISIYLIFYFAIFGRETVKWLFINSVLGILGIFSQIDWILSVFSKTFGEFPWYVHIVPTIYFILYTFLIRRAVLHIFRAEPGTSRASIVEWGYVIISMLIYLVGVF